MKLSKSRVLVTGAAGFIGTHLTKKLLSLKTEIVALDNFSTGTKDNLAFFDGEIIESNVMEKCWFDKIRGDIDYIFHLGAPSSVVLFNKEPVNCFNETRDGFLNVMRFAKQKSVAKVIYPSSSSVYGSTPPPQSERDIPLTKNLYGVAKLTCERIAKLFSNNVENVGLRIFAGYGPNEDHKGPISSPVTLFTKSIVRNEQPTVFGDGNQSRDFIYIDDLVEAIVRSAENQTPPIINVGCGRSYKFNEVINMINEYLGKNVKPKYSPEPDSYMEETQADITLMQRNLGINPLPLEKGLKRYLEFEKFGTANVEKEG